MLRASEQIDSDPAFANCKLPCNTIRETNDEHRCSFRGLVPKPVVQPTILTRLWVHVIRQTLSSSTFPPLSYASALSSRPYLSCVLGWYGLCLLGLHYFLSLIKVCLSFQRNATSCSCSANTSISIVKWDWQLGSLWHDGWFDGSIQRNCIRANYSKSQACGKIDLLFDLYGLEALVVKYRLRVRLQISQECVEFHRLNLEFHSSLTFIPEFSRLIFSPARTDISTWIRQKSTNSTIERHSRDQRRKPLAL